MDVEAHTGGGGSGGGSGEAPPPPEFVIVPVVAEDGTDVGLRQVGVDLGGAVTCGAVVICDPFPASVSLADIASFRPASPVQRMDPTGWAITGLPANFYTSVPVEVQSGRLLGLDARVRFSAVGFHWDYGDGSAADSATGGASWAALGVPEFSETATGHTYTARGDYAVVLTVRLAAEYSFAGRPWAAIPGSILVRSAPMTVHVGTASTVLVGRDCAQNPTGPGC